VAGGRVEVGEANCGLTQLEGQERDRVCAVRCAAIDKGIEERQVRLVARQVDTLDAVLRAALNLAGLAPDVQARGINAVPTALGELVGGRGAG
jgi:hypothetical protein